MTRQDKIDLLMTPIRNRAEELKVDPNHDETPEQVDEQLQSFEDRYASYTDVQLTNMVMINF